MAASLALPRSLHHREAIESFAQAGAFASFVEHIKSCIAPGHWADFEVLGDSSYQTDSAQIKEIPVLQTWIDEEQV